MTDLIDNVKGGDNVQAAKDFNSIMADKLTAAMDAKKIEVASTLQDRQSSRSGAIGNK